MENQDTIIETVHIKTPMTNHKVINPGIKTIPENVKALELICSRNDKFKENCEENNTVDYSFLNRFKNLEFLYISSSGKDGLITSINQEKVKLPETLKGLMLSELDYYTDLINFDFLKDLPNLEVIYLHKFYNDFNSIYENNVEKIKANLVNPEKVKILDQTKKMFKEFKYKNFEKFLNLTFEEYKNKLKSSYD